MSDARRAWAEEVIAREERRDSDTVKLATLLAPAVLIEPELLRAVRLRCLPKLSPSAEADLWFSELVRSREPIGLTLHRPVAEALCLRLRNQWAEPSRRGRPCMARREMERVHASTSPAIALEERVAWLTIEGDTAGVEAQLNRVLTAIASGSRPGLARWARTAAARLPLEARGTAAGWLLAQAGHKPGPRRLRPLSSTPEGLHDVALDGLLAALEPVKLGVRRSNGTLQVGEVDGPGTVAILVPDTAPRLLRLQWPDSPEPRSAEIAVPVGEALEHDVGDGALEIRTATGDVYAIPAPAPQDEVDASSSREDTWRFDGDTEEGHHGTVRTIAISPSGRLAATAGNSSNDRTIKIWDLEQRRLMMTLDDAATEGGRTVLAFSPHEHLLAAGEENAAQIWDINSGKQMMRHELRTTATALAFGGDEHLFVASEDAVVARISLVDGDVLTWSPGEDSAAAPVSAMSLAREGDYIAFTRDNAVELWGTDQGLVKQVPEPAGEQRLIWQAPPLCVAGPAHILFGAPLRRWDISSDSVTRMLPDDEAIVAVAPGRALALVGESTIEAIDLGAPQVRISLDTAPEAIACVALSADGQTVMAGDYEHNVRVWRLPPPAMVTPEHGGVSSDAEDETIASDSVFRIEMLPAEHGDALWISYGSAQAPRHVLVGAGVRRTYSAHLQPRLAASTDDARRIELLVLTHTDADHVEGALPLLDDESLGVRIGEVWLNDVNVAVPEASPRRSKVAEQLLSLIERRAIPRNRVFEGRAIQVQPNDPLPRVELDGGLKVTVLCPRAPDTATTGPDPGAEATEAAEKEAPARPGSLDVEALAERPFRPDSSPQNRGSLALLLDFEGRRLLLGGDAPAAGLTRSLRSLGDELGVERVALDAFVIPHKGSARNLSNELLAEIECHTFLVSTNGSRFRHPDRETIARILVNGGPGLRLCFNYRSEWNEIWDDEKLQAQYGYEAIYPEADPGLLVDLKSS